MSKIDLWSTMRAWEELEIDANLVVAKDMKSRMRRESHVRFRESLKGKFLRATRPKRTKNKCATSLNRYALISKTQCIYQKVIQNGWQK